MAIFTKFRSAIVAASLAIPMAVLPTAQAHAGVFVGISIGIAPPALPVYVQPPLPAPGYIWTPGYWAYGDAGYYWVPGVWVAPPQPGFLWTPAYWGWEGGFYRFHGGYWGPHVGYYGGINYGFGYGGIGFCGGGWHGGVFAYNSAVNNFGGVHVTNVYRDTTIVNNTTIINNNHVSYNGGTGGINHAPTAEESRFANERHIEPTANQQQHFQAAAQDRTQYAAFNHGRPGTAAAVSPTAYHQVAQQHAQAQPLTSQDRQVGKAYNPNTRMANQDQRIAGGLKSGQLSSGEAARAERTQSNIDNQVHADRAANGGKLTGQERNQINNEQNAASQQIYNEKHNGNTVTPNALDNREANQQARTAQGLRTGQMTAGEAGRANNNQANTAQQIHNERTTGGGITQQQRQQINQQQNRNSGQIYNERHNAQVARPAPAPRPAPAARPAPAPRPAPAERQGGGGGGHHGR